MPWQQQLSRYPCHPSPQAQAALNALHEAVSEISMDDLLDFPMESLDSCAVCDDAEEEESELGSEYERTHDANGDSLEY